MIKTDRDSGRPHRFDKALVEFGDDFPIALPAHEIEVAFLAEAVAKLPTPLT
jgi:hypothetical protein